MDEKEVRVRLKVLDINTRGTKKELKKKLQDTNTGEHSWAIEENDSVADILKSMLVSAFNNVKIEPDWAWKQIICNIFKWMGNEKQADFW